MDLCGVCENLFRAIFRNHEYSSGAVELLLSARSCRFCDVLASCLGNPSALYTRTIRDILTASENDSVLYQARRYTSQIVFSFQIQGCPSNTYVQFALWADEGSPAATLDNIRTVPPLACPSSTNQKVKHWLESCRETHDECLSLISGGFIDESCEPELPKRILNIGGRSASSEIQLVETEGCMRGHYAALSHCWGPPAKRPLLTTTTTLQSHLKGIDIEDLPKTFRDAVHVVRDIGLQYLWIDSLCILQDNEKEWEEEAGKMGSIYEMAMLTIAASGAHDSTEGCYISKSWGFPPTRIPYYSSPGEDVASGIIYAQQIFECSPAWGPLKRRGWAFQERRLSRRMVHFTQGGLSWKCRNIELDEWDGDIDMVEYPMWDVMMESYSDSEFTYESDRLIALQGLANEMQKARQDRYCFGIWTAQLPGLLLWTKEQNYPESESHSKVPSWSWASRAGPKAFWTCTEDCLPFINPDQISINSHGVMEMRGVKIGRCTIAENEVDDYCVHHQDFRDLLSKFKNARFDPLHYIQNVETENHDVVGVAVLDGESGASLHGLVMMRADFPDTSKTTRGVEPPPISADTSEPEDSDCFCGEERMPLYCPDQKANWILLLEELPGSSSDNRNSRRAGVGLVVAEWMEEKPPCDLIRIM